MRELRGDELDGWDEAAVDAPGGHVYQSRAWAAHRSATGWRPRFLASGDIRALVLVRPWPGLPGGSAYLTRGPVGPSVPWSVGPAPAANGTGSTLADALVATAARLAGEGVDVLAADPEVSAADAAYTRTLADAGFSAIPEIQPSRHRMALRLAGADEAGILDGVAKATRQRIRRAEQDGVIVIRHDARARPADGLVEATEDPRAAFERFQLLMTETGNRRGFEFPGPGDFIGWWCRAYAAGHVVYLEACEGARDGETLGGLLLYRHGSRLSTQHGADRADRRRDHPGTMHLLRWRAIQLAIAEGRTEMDLGGVDLPGAHRVPLVGEPTFGLFEHKRSFGAEWVALAGAQERVARPWRYLAGRAAVRAARILRAWRYAR
ncbi:MAG: GNAT family N-acetyltransferase [Candidatus Limnocylindrales bacterium]